MMLFVYFLYILLTSYENGVGMNISAKEYTELLQRISDLESINHKESRLSNRDQELIDVVSNLLGQLNQANVLLMTEIVYFLAEQKTLDIVAFYNKINQKYHENVANEENVAMLNVVWQPLLKMVHDAIEYNRQRSMVKAEVSKNTVQATTKQWHSWAETR